MATTFHINSFQHHGSPRRSTCTSFSIYISFSEWLTTKFERLKHTVSLLSTTRSLYSVRQRMWYTVSFRVSTLTESITYVASFSDLPTFSLSILSRSTTESFTNCTRWVPLEVIMPRQLASKAILSGNSNINLFIAFLYFG